MNEGIYAMTIRARFDESRAKSRARRDAARERRTARRQATLLATVFFGAIIVPQAIAGGDPGHPSTPAESTKAVAAAQAGSLPDCARVNGNRSCVVWSREMSEEEVAQYVNGLEATLAAERKRSSALREQLARERKRHSATISRLRGVIMGKTSVRTALRLAAVTHGVSERELRRVALCESTLDANAVGPASSDGRPVGLMQFKPAKWSETPYRFLPRTDPYASAMSAAYVVRREGWRAWECRP